MSLASLSLRDLLDERGGDLGEYVSLSLTYRDGDTRISLTTTGVEPVTYTTVIHEAAGVDWPSLVLVAQRRQ